MNLLQQTQQLLKNNELFAKKALGQNFLISEKALNKIMTAADIQANNFVLEIGPGTGNLSRLIASKTENFLAIEKDPDMLKLLDGIPVKEMDALDFAPSELPTPYKVIANIPYYITSPLINHYLKEQFIKEGGNPPELMVLLIQKEVAEKICDPKFNSFLSINIKTFGKPSIVATVKKGCFLPAPKVDSAILKIEVFKTPLVDCDLKQYFTVCSQAFSSPRKTLRNNLKSLIQAKNLILENIEKESGIDLSLRAEKLDPEQLASLTKVIFKNS